MAETLKKAAVAQFLEAVKSSLNHLSQLKMELGERDQPQNGVDERSLLQLYSRVRRVREYLRRWLSAYPTPEQLDMPEDDINLLCSCLVYELGLAEKQVTEKSMTSKDDLPWIEKRKGILSHWTVELATAPIEQLPTLWQRNDVQYEVRQVLVAVRQKTSAASPSETPSGVFRLGPTFHGQESDGSGGPVAPGSTGAAPQSATSIAVGSGQIVDPNRIRDYRIRLTMVLDVRAFHRCVEAEDYRLALVMLNMILQGVLLDYGLLRGNELGLTGQPSEWPLDMLAAHILETDFGDRDRSALQILASSRRALEPVSQLENPLVVNKPMLQEVEVFVRKLAQCVGVVAGSESGIRPGLAGPGGGNTAVDAVF